MNKLNQKHEREFSCWLLKISNHLERLGWEKTYTSKNRNTKKISSRYFERGDKRIRLSEHRITTGFTANGKLKSGDQRGGKLDGNYIIEFENFDPDIDPREFAEIINKENEKEGNNYEL